MVRCSVHSAALAAWSCEVCHRDLCELCAAPLDAGRGIVPCCVACGGFARPILVERAQLAPFDSRAVRAAARELLRPRTALLVVLLTCAAEYAISFDGPAWTCGHLLLWGWAAFASRRASHGYAPFALPAWTDVGAAWTAVLPKLFVGTAGIGLAAALLVDFGHRAAPSSFAACLLAALAAWLLPGAWVAAIVDGEGARWPVPWALPALGPAALPLRLAAVLLGAAELAGSFLPPLEVFAGDLRLGTHIVQATAVRFGQVVALGLFASLAGSFVFTRAAELLHGDPETHRVPVRPEAVPRGKRPLARE